MAMAEYHQDLDAILRWSTGRIAVIWSAYRERQAAISKAIREASGADSRADRRDLPRRGRGPRNRSDGFVVEGEARNMTELARALNIKAEPYPGATPFNQET